MLLLLLSIWALAALPLGVSAVLPSRTERGDNTFGAVLFFGYILAALYFTSYILRSISRIGPLIQSSSESGHVRVSSHTHKQNGRAGQTRNRRAFRVFSTLALASFAILSWNMLNFLVLSYMEWASTHGLPTTLRLHKVSEIWHALGHIWLWATGSNLFQTFAEDLVSDPAQWKVVRAALIYSYASNSWMSALGDAANISDLWAYFVLDQILPISFTQNLFCMALTRTTRTSYGIYRIEQGRLFLFCVKSVGLLCYLAALYQTPSTLNTAQFFPTLFTLRVLLFFPYLVDRLANWLRISTSPSSGFTTGNFNKFLVVMTVIVLTYTSLSESRTDADKMITSLNPNYAAAALSHDLLISSLGSVTYFFLF